MRARTRLSTTIDSDDGDDVKRNDDDDGGSKKMRRDAGGYFLLALYTAFCAAMMGLVLWRYMVLPTPLGLDAPASAFSEARAMVHLKAMSSIGRSWVGTRSNDAMAQYLASHCHALSEPLVARNSRFAPRLKTDVQVCLFVFFWCV